MKRARTLRRTLSLPEGLLWRAIRHRPDGLKFRRQHPAGIYVLDFYCAEARLAIEVDGMAHDGEERQQRDARRDFWLAERGVSVLRIPAADVLGCLDHVVELIVDQARSRIPLHQPAAGPPPCTGEE